ncbi:MAG: 3-deoxy-D-manno-octulosonic acid transferase [Rhodoferax sp.]|nr:3-deoxy-D-manno-octulosonic acid transferase [Rhodoferax sp.]
MWLAQPLLRRKLRRRGQHEAGYLHAVDERLGHYPALLPAHTGPTVWIHAVSLGETRAAAVLIAALRARLPAIRLLLTHGTATGRAEGIKLLHDGDLQAWLPWDTAGAVQRFLAHFKPSIGVLMETEIWPNLVHTCKAQGVPLVLANARLSDKSLRQAQRLSWLARPAYAALSAVWAQTEADAQRLRSLGAPVRGVLGNLKFDATPDAVQLARGRAWRVAAGRPVVMFASSREGEELALLQILKEYWLLVHTETVQADTKKIAPQVQWLIVPRHPQRFDEVAKLIQSHGFSVSRRSTWRGDGPAAVGAPGNGAAPCIWLGDSLGEMALYFGLADVALLGGSFEPLGGQNLIEAAACGCPVVMGPHTFNFAQAAEQALAVGAAIRVGDLAQAVTEAQALLGDVSRATQVRQAAERFALAHQGAAARLADAVCQEVRSVPRYG